MSDPILYTIIRNLQAALGAMTVAGGYYYAVAVAVVKLDPNHKVEDLIAPDGPRPFIVLEVKPEAWNYLPANEVRLVVPMTVYWIGASTPTVDESRLLVFTRGCADVERAIAVDITRGGLPVDTRIVKCTKEPSTEAAQVWAMVDIEVRLYRTFGAP